MSKMISPVFEGFPISRIEQQKLDQQAKNDPLKDGFVRSNLVEYQSSELKSMGIMGRWDAERKNKVAE